MIFLHLVPFAWVNGIVLVCVVDRFYQTKNTVAYLEQTSYIDLFIVKEKQRKGNTQMQKLKKKKHTNGIMEYSIVKCECKQFHVGMEIDILLLIVYSLV